MKAALIAVWFVMSCSEHDKTEVKHDPERPRRVIEPPSGRVRPLPPHAIRADGVGPYRLRASLSELLEQLPSGPRIATLDVPGVVHRSLLRAEEDAILIGGEPLGKATFIAVVGADVARTESGVHVGSNREELVRGLGAASDELDRARDPRTVTPSGMRNARIVFDGDRIVAFVVTSEAEAARPQAKDPTTTSPCQRPQPDPDSKRFGACLANGELVATDGDELVVRSAEPERTDRVISRAGVRGTIVFAAPLRSPNDPRDELVVVVRSETAEQRTWWLWVFRLEGARLIRTIEPAPLYQLSASSARWIGAELRDLDLYLELTARPDAIEVGGLLTTRIAEKIRDVVVISPLLVTRRHAKSAPPEAVDAGISDGPTEPEDAMSSDHHPQH